MLRRDVELGWVIGRSPGGERWDGEEEGEIECWQSGYISTVVDRITDEHCYSSVSPPVTVPRHCTEILV